MPDRPTLGEILHTARIAGGEQRPRPWPPESWADRDLQLRALDEAMAAAVEAAVRERLRTHEHEWTRCPECKQPGRPCPCSGVPCCEMERREIAAANEAARDERERIRQMAIRNEAVCTGDEGTSCYFADLLTEPEGGDHA
jgi:hypothetical protein